ncbi:3-oxoacyl-[acyl-carrier-protein] synthase-3 [Alkalihalobacillus xiaoxiensis]|uniref:Beta-ketoacyl-[acyl-carrier-protein] synthase III n=1 Tax=Shouchella xiaoxiensis TaxID=766895 RepID=A0ABS2SNH3_9BACI|nr:ketoacyl-ACP synthase III [Shouchella xiaoxiensis]MBM7837068.1 3-oxoacyl-[acyl-carrier-protein] synthase-3 [Shouchella xiaoxiensis]
MQSKAQITAIGSYVPTGTLTNHDLEKMVETNDEWIVQRTGIKERRIVEPGQYTSDLAYQAAIDLKTRYNKDLADVDMIIVCTLTPDYKTPSVASVIQDRLGINHAGAIDLNAACAGFTYGLHVANGLITAGLNKKILVVGAETLSKVTDMEDRTTCILFGDGAGAALIELNEENPSFLSFHLGSEGKGGKHLYSTNLSDQMAEKELVNSGNLVQNGREVYKWAVSSVPKGMKQVMDNAQIPLSDVNWFIPHSANLRMIESICTKSDLPIEKTLYSLVHYGNTSSATIPLALDLGIKANKVKKDDLILLYGFGGGLAQAGLLIKWGIDPA